jgi:23S rRNA (cytosine1962-C5)-methyltransferase
MHLSLEMLTDIVRRVAAKTQRNIQILEIGHQAPDHPIHPAIPETAYLKTLICRVM